MKNSKPLIQTTILLVFLAIVLAGGQIILDDAQDEASIKDAEDLQMQMEYASPNTRDSSEMNNDKIDTEFDEDTSTEEAVTTTIEEIDEILNTTNLEDFESFDDLLE